MGLPQLTNHMIQDKINMYNCWCVISLKPVVTPTPQKPQQFSALRGAASPAPASATLVGPDSLPAPSRTPPAWCWWLPRRWRFGLPMWYYKCDRGTSIGTVKHMLIYIYIYVNILTYLCIHIYIYIYCIYIYICIFYLNIESSVTMGWPILYTSSMILKKS